MQLNQISKDRIEALAMGSHEAFHEVFRVFYPKVRAFAMGFMKNEADADDIVQTVFIKLWTKRGMLQKVENLDTYLYTITKNTVLNQMASYKAFTVDIMSMREATSSTASPLEQIEAQDLKLLIDMVVEHMPPQRQTIYRMSRNDGLSNDEIAKQLGLQKKTVENHLYLALGEIREMLKILILLIWAWE